VRGKDGGVANTNIVWHAGKLLAVEEGHEPFAIDPDTLASQGYWNFAGALKTGRFTAHPKMDPETGEMVFFAYNVGGAFTTRIAYGFVDRTGRLTRLETFEAPYSALVHDFLVTRNYLLFPILPLTGSLERWVTRQEYRRRYGPPKVWTKVLSDGQYINELQTGGVGPTACASVVALPPSTAVALAGTARRDRKPEPVWVP